MNFMLRCFSIWQSFWNCLQNGSVFCICRNASNLSTVSDFGVVHGVLVTSGTMASVCGVVSSDEWCWTVLLLVLNAGPSRLVAESMLIVVGLSWGYSTICKRQSAALFLGSRYPLKSYNACGQLYSPSVYFVIYIFPSRYLVNGLWSLHTIISASWR